MYLSLFNVLMYFIKLNVLIFSSFIASILACFWRKLKNQNQSDNERETPPDEREMSPDEREVS